MFASDLPDLPLSPCFQGEWEFGIMVFVEGGPREKLWVQGRERSNKLNLHVMLDPGINPGS